MALYPCRIVPKHDAQSNSFFYYEVSFRADAGSVPHKVAAGYANTHKSAKTAIDGAIQCHQAHFKDHPVEECWVVQH
jgi:hypothetical protein